MADSRQLPSVQPFDAIRHSNYFGSLAIAAVPGTNMLWTIFVILLILWLLGFGFHVAGSLIHLLLVVALIVLVVNLVTGRRAV